MTLSWPLRNDARHPRASRLRHPSPAAIAQKMKSSLFIILLVPMAWRTTAAEDTAVTDHTLDPNRLQICVISDTNNGTTRGISSGSSSSEMPYVHCPHVKASDCKSQHLIRCGPCMTCLVYLERGDACKLPYETNARCSPDLVCYTRGTCGDFVR